jgi:Tfp pilus assembly protein PilV
MKTSVPAATLDARGATLIEVIVSVMVFSVGVLSLMAGSLVAARAMKDSRDFAIVTAAAQTKLDSLASLGWSAIGGQSGSGTVRGHDLAWSVTGDDPRTIQVIVTRRISPSTVTDTLMTRLHK